MDSEYYDLGKEPKKVNDIGYDDKKMYPCLYLDPEDYSDLTEFKLKDTGVAEIIFRITSGGLEVKKIKFKGRVEDIYDTPKPKKKSAMYVMVNEGSFDGAEKRQY